MRNYQLYLIRHGITEGNLKGLYVGSGTDLPLCEEGRSQLYALRDRFTYPEVNTVFSSPLSRAVETAEILFPGAGKKLVIQDLREMAFGVYEGKEVKSLVKDPDFARWMDPSSGYTPPHAEDTADFHTRCREVLMHMFEYMMKTQTFEAACVTHGGVIMSMMAQKAVPVHRPEEWMADPGCGYTLRMDTSIWMRDGLAEAVEVLPWGYLDGEEMQQESE